MTQEESAPPLTGTALTLAAIGLSLATFIDVLDYSIANVSIPYISGDLGISTDQGTYVITSFAVGSAIGLPITGFLTRRYGALRIVLLSILLFTFFSFLCGCSRDIALLVINRFFQGVASGPLIPLSQALIVRCFPEARRASALVYWSVIVVVAPVLGPILGGVISYDYHWPWIFYINVPIGLFSAAAIYHTMRQFETAREKVPIDWIGLILLAVSMTCLQIFLDKGQQFDWFRSPIIRTLTGVSLVSFVYLVLWQWHHPHPLIDLRLFRIRTFSCSILFISLAYGIYFGGVVLVPLWLQVWMGYTSPWAGLAVAPIGIVPFLFGRSMTYVMRRWGILWPLALCFVLLALSSFYTAYFDTDADFWHIAFSRFSFGCGLLFFFTPLISLSVQDVPTEHVPSSAGIFHFFRALFGGIGTSLFTTLWFRRASFHHSNLVSQLNPWSPNTEQALAAMQQLGLTEEASWATLELAANQQAHMLALNDCFWLMGWVFVGLIPVLLLCRKKGEDRSTLPVDTIAPHG